MISYYQRLENFLNVTWRHAEDADTNAQIHLMNQCYGVILFSQWNNFISETEYNKLWKEDYLPAFKRLIKSKRSNDLND